MLNSSILHSTPQTRSNKIAMFILELVVFPEMSL